MKKPKKKSFKKLSLHRETVRHLDSQDLGGILGGFEYSCDHPMSGCPSCFSSMENIQ